MTTRTAACWSKQQAAGPRIVPRPERMTMTTDQTTALYDAIDAFQRTHRLPGLQHAQIRGLLAEHLARALPAAVPVPPPTNRAAVRAAALREAADFVGNDDDCDCGGCDSCVPNKLAAELRRRAAEEQPVETQWPGERCGLCPPGTRTRHLEDHMVQVHGARPTARPAVAEQPDTQTREALCRCGHGRDRHAPDVYGTGTCADCPGDEERSWRHPFTPAP